MIIEGLVGKVDNAKEQRIKKAKANFFYFASHYLPHHFSSTSAEYQKLLIDIVNKQRLTSAAIGSLKPFIKKKYHVYMRGCKNIEGIIDVEPRGFSKSTRFSLAYPLWRVLSGKSIFPIIFSASQDMARTVLESIKEELVENENIYKDFGDMRGSIWKSDFITLKNGSAIVAKGSGTSVRGIRYREHRPDLIICDDLMKDDTATSKVVREKTYKWFKRTVIPLGKDVMIVMVNTIFHSADIVSRLLTELQEGKLKNWVGFRFGAITPTGESLWPEYWSKEKLQAKKEVMGSIAFSCEMMNEPLSDEDRMFKEGWIQYYQAIRLSDLKVYMGADPALGAIRGDDSAIVTIGVDSEGIIYVLDAWAENLSPDAFVKKIIEKYIAFKPSLIAFEDILFQKVLKQVLIRKAAKYGVYLPVIGVSPHISKDLRVGRLSPIVENGLIKFRKNQKKLVDQLLMFPKGAHDDLPDALENAVSITGGHSGPPEYRSVMQGRTFPYGSF